MTAVRLIVNADDYGRSRNISRGIREAHLKGIVTSTTCMMNFPTTATDIRQAREETPDLGLGVHLVLTSGSPVLPAAQVPGLVGAEGEFYKLAPFIVRRPAWQIAVLAGLSLLARAIAAANGLITDPFNYRFFPFELALFLTGALAYKAWAAHKTVWAQPRLRLLALAVPLALASYRWWPGGWPVDAFFVPARLVLLALVATGLPAIHAWRGRSAADRAVGELSYPLYLGHLLVLGLIAGIPALKADPDLLSLATAGAGLALAWAAVRLVDSRIEALRRTLAARAGASA